jgi:hypothetical protein
MIPINFIKFSLPVCKGPENGHPFQILSALYSSLWGKLGNPEKGHSFLRSSQEESFVREVF